MQSPTLDRIVSPGQKVCIVISDISRLWQSTHVCVPAMVEALNACGIPDRDMVLLVATGAHRRHMPEEHARLVSADIARRIRVAVEADRIILCSGVVFHFLAGFGGCPKMLVPGICGHETIQRHHKLALDQQTGRGARADVRCGVLEERNIFQVDLLEGAALLKPCLALNVATDADNSIVQAFAGHWVAAHREACALVDAMHRVDIARRTPLAAVIPAP